VKPASRIWSNECVETGTPSDIDPSINPELEGRSTLEVMDAVVNAAGERGIAVLLGHQLARGDEQQELWYTSSYPEEQWLQDWRVLATRYATNPAVVGADLAAEPHGPACWGCGEPARDWYAAAGRAGAVIQQVAPRWLVVVAGVQTAQGGAASWWGSELSDVRKRPLELKVPRKVVYAVHDWPPTVSGQPWFDDPSYPANLPAVWERKWGFLLTEKTAPVIVTGFGTPYRTATDKQWLDTFVKYLDTRSVSFAYWAWNHEPDSGAGLVKADWSTPEPNLRTALAPLLD
jgi:endoglucanase